MQTPRKTLRNSLKGPHNSLGSCLERHVIRGSWTEKTCGAGPFLMLLGVPLIGRQF